MSFSILNKLADIAARLVRITRRDVFSVSKQKHIVAARHVIAWIVRNVFSMSLPDTARAMRMLDHTSALNACRQVDRELQAGKGRRADLLFDVMGELAMGGAQ